MAESSGHVLIDSKNQLDENENPPLCDFNTNTSLTDSTEGSNSLNSEIKKTSENSYCVAGNTGDMSLNEYLASTRTISSNSGFQCELLENEVLANVSNNSLPESLNNNLINGMNESGDIWSTLPGPNFVENSPCTSETKIPNINKELNNSALPDSILLNANFDTGASFSCHVLDETCAVPYPNVFNDSAFGFNALQEINNQTPATEDRPQPSEHTPTREFKLNGATNLVDIFGEKALNENPQGFPSNDHECVPNTDVSFEGFPNTDVSFEGFSNTDVSFEGFPNTEGNFEGFPNTEGNFEGFPNTEGNFEGFPNSDNQEGEEFQDAVQFFKDPSSLQFLENIKTSNQQQSFIPRDSLYVKFDPLHNHVVQPSSIPVQGLVDVKEEIPNTVDNVSEENIPESSESNTQSLVNKHINSTTRESFGNILLSFDSPMKSNSAEAIPAVESSPFSNAPKLYTEEEVQQIVKNKELSLQEMYLKKQREMEEEILKKAQVKDESFNIMSELCRGLHETLAEFTLLLTYLKHENISLISKVGELESEKIRLENSLKTSSEELQSVELSFSGFHKRYMQSKDMIKKLTDNEKCYKEEIDSLHKKLEEQEQMYNMLQTKTEEMVEKANFEITSARKGGDAQLAVLKAQLKKSELKVSSLESDLKQVKIENDKLSGICDDLMAKVSGS